MRAEVVIASVLMVYAFACLLGIVKGIKDRKALKKMKEEERDKRG